MIAQELEVSLHMAFVEARQKRHEFITVEHLLLALLDNPTAGEVLRVDTGCLVAFSESVDYDIQFQGGFKNALFGGEGLFLAKVEGPGKVFLQSLPFSRLADRIVAASRGYARQGETNRGGSGALGAIGGLAAGGLLGGLLGEDN